MFVAARGTFKFELIWLPTTFPWSASLCWLLVDIEKPEAFSLCSERAGSEILASVLWALREGARAGSAASFLSMNLNLSKLKNCSKRAISLKAFNV
jgi:hypothetical protein